MCLKIEACREQSMGLLVLCATPVGLKRNGHEKDAVFVILIANIDKMI